MGMGFGMSVKLKYSRISFAESSISCNHAFMHFSHCSISAL